MLYTIIKDGDNMDVINIITTVGFPIACCISMGCYIKQGDERHEQEVDKLRNSIDNNTDAISELIYFLKGGGKS